MTGLILLQTGVTIKIPLKYYNLHLQENISYVIYQCF